MYFLSKFCFVCYTKSNVLDLSDQDSDGISHVYKLTSSLAGMDFEAIYDASFICGKCCTTLNTVYKFQQKCLRSKTNLLTYVSQLQTFSRVRGAFSVRLTDIQQEMEAENQNARNQTKYIKREDVQRTGTDHVSNDHTYDSDEYYYNVHENNVNINIKEGEITHLNDKDHFGILGEDLHVEIKNEIDIDEDPLCGVKEELMSDTETLPGGPSQGYEDAADLKGASEHAGVSLYEYEEAQNTSNAKETLTMHNQTHSSKGKNECGICKNSFCSKQSLIKHLRIHTGEKPFECEICLKRFTQSSTLNSHMRSHTGEKPYECEICHKKFSHRSYIVIHRQIHTGKLHECEICQKKFSQKSRLQHHMRIHTDERPYKCVSTDIDEDPLCGVKEEPKSDTETPPDGSSQGYEHAADLTGTTEHAGVNLYECKERFPTGAALATYVHTHTGGTRLYTGEEGQNTCILKETLTTHMQTHSAKGKNECYICKKLLASKTTLKRHIRLHTGEKPYECEICNKKFHQTNTLNDHMRLHTGEKPYECEICRKKFTQKGTLKGHMRVHTGEKPFECEMCQEKFTHTILLYLHMRKHNGEKPLSVINVRKSSLLNLI